MPAFSATTPGKIILLGEHAVVYGQPAIAVPVNDVQARAVVRPEVHREPGSLRLLAPQIELDATHADLPEGHPLRAAISGVMAELDIPHMPACTIHITSTIPIAAGLGSSAAVTAAVIRAVAGFLGQPLPLEKVSSLTHEVEKIHHGTPSGIDNAVVTYNQPIWFEKDKPIRPLSIAQPFTLVIADSGRSAATRETVAAVREAYQAEREHYQALFDNIGTLVQQANTALKAGDIPALGLLMDKNHHLLQDMEVSSPELDRLVNQARMAGALGAKLSGGGRGGNIIALVEENGADKVAKAAQQAGASHTITTTVSAS